MNRNQKCIENRWWSTDLYRTHVIYQSQNKDRLLSDLRDADDSNKLSAVQGLGRVICPDGEVIDALRAFEDCNNDELCEAVKGTIARIQKVLNES